MKKSLKIILLFILLLLLQFYVYINSEYTTINALIYGFCDIVLYSILLMIVPILMRLHNGKKFENENYKKAADVNNDNELNTGDTFLLKKQVLGLSNIEL